MANKTLRPLLTIALVIFFLGMIPAISAGSVHIPGDDAKKCPPEIIKFDFSSGWKSEILDLYFYEGNWHAAIDIKDEKGLGIIFEDYKTKEILEYYQPLHPKQISTFLIDGNHTKGAITARLVGPNKEPIGSITATKPK